MLTSRRSRFILARALSQRALPASALLALVGCTSPDILDPLAAENVVVEEAPPPVPESDEVPAADAVLTNPDGSTTDLGRVRSVTDHPSGGVLVVDVQAHLSLVTQEVNRRLLDGVEGRPVVLPDGRVVATSAEDPVDTDLWLVTIDGAPAQRLTDSPGSDGAPFVLEDGRVMFLSSRTGVTSLFVVDPTTGAASQLTNEGEQPGRLSDRFVPPPAVGEPWQEGSRVFYDAGDAVWSVDVVTGAAEVVR